jgi:hypothetical protein
MHYPTMDADDIPFVEAIDLNTQQEEGLENHAYEDRRVQHLDFKNVTFADALLRGALHPSAKPIKISVFTYC